MYLCGQQEETSSHLPGDTERWTLTWDRCGWNSKTEVLGTQVLDPAGQAPPTLQQIQGSSRTHGSQQIWKAVS